MRFEELGPHHEVPFIEMLGDFKSDDPGNRFAVHAGLETLSPSEIRRFLNQCEDGKMDWRPKARSVSKTHYILLDETGRICGNGLMRFPLDTTTENEGGNLVFDVPPSMRGHGYGALTLNGLLFEAVRAGLARALVTCNTDHTCTVRAIERNRGELEDIIISKSPGNEGQKVSRYWIRFR